MSSTFLVAEFLGQNYCSTPIITKVDREHILGRQSTNEEATFLVKIQILDLLVNIQILDLLVKIQILVLLVNIQILDHLVKNDVN